MTLNPKIIYTQNIFLIEVQGKEESSEKLMEKMKFFVKGGDVFSFFKENPFFIAFNKNKNSLFFTVIDLKDNLKDIHSGEAVRGKNEDSVRRAVRVRGLHSIRSY